MMHLLLMIEYNVYFVAYTTNYSFFITDSTDIFPHILNILNNTYITTLINDLIFFHKKFFPEFFYKPFFLFNTPPPIFLLKM